MSRAHRRTLRASADHGPPHEKLLAARPALAPPSTAATRFTPPTCLSQYELRVLEGAKEALAAKRFRYILYEFSPFLMRTGHLGEPKRLASLLPSFGAICFDVMGLHNLFPRPSTPLREYYRVLNSGHNSYLHPNRLNNDGVGPWDDIMCWFPEAPDRASVLPKEPRRHSIMPDGSQNPKTVDPPALSARPVRREEAKRPAASGATGRPSSLFAANPGARSAASPRRIETPAARRTSSAQPGRLR